MFGPILRKVVAPLLCLLPMVLAAEAGNRTAQVANNAPPGTEAQPIRLESEQQRFAGIWHVVRMERGGRYATAAELRQIAMSLRFGSGGKLGGEVQGEKWTGQWSVNPGQSPGQIDITTGAGRVPGIYEFRGDQLVICDHDVAGPRPTRFDSRGAAEATLLTLSRWPVPAEKLP